MEVTLQLGTTIVAAASVIYVAHSSKDFLLAQKRALTGTFQDYFFPDDYKKKMWEYARFAKNIEQEKGAKFCYPTGLLQAVLHRTYGYSFAEVMLIQKVIDWYLPRVKEKFYPTGLENHLLPLQGQHFFEPITEKELVTEEDLSNTRDMLALFVSALEARYQDIAILPERSPSVDPDQISEMRAFEQQCLETRSQRSPSRSSASDDTQSVIETELSEGVSDHEHVLHNLEPSEAQREMWYEMSAHHLSNLAEKSSQIPQKAFHVVVMTELETTLSMSFINKLLSRLEELSSNGLMFKLIIGFTYETPNQMGQRVQDLSEYLRQQITQRLPGNSPLLAERPLPISFVDMTVSEDCIRATFFEEFKAEPCEQVVLILNPEQASVYDHFKKMTDLDVLVSILPRSPEEGSHPEHWLQALRQTFRLRDATTRKHWSDYLAGQQDTSFSMTVGLQQSALNNPQRLSLYENLQAFDEERESADLNILQYLYQTLSSVLGEEVGQERISECLEQKRPFHREDSGATLVSNGSEPDDSLFHHQQSIDQQDDIRDQSEYCFLSHDGAQNYALYLLSEQRIQDDELIKPKPQRY